MNQPDNGMATSVLRVVITDKTSPYYTNPRVHRLIDEALHKCAVIHQNLGKSTTRKEKADARKFERQTLREVLHLDPEFVGAILKAHD